MGGGGGRRDSTTRTRARAGRNHGYIECPLNSSRRNQRTFYYIHLCTVFFLQTSIHPDLLQISHDIAYGLFSFPYGLPASLQFHPTVP